MGNRFCTDVAINPVIDQMSAITGKVHSEHFIFSAAWNFRCIRGPFRPFPVLGNLNVLGMLSASEMSGFIFNILNRHRIPAKFFYRALIVNA
ncbi:hypothetical protein D3C77_431990 [compost metagenome]